MSDALYHLLVKGKFEVWCRPGKKVGDYNVTIYPTKANCANCLTAYRAATTTQGRTGRFQVRHTNRLSRRD